jgi:TonB family protein
MSAGVEMPWIELLGVALNAIFIVMGIRAIVQRRVVWRPRGSRPDSDYTYVGRDAVEIGAAMIVAGLFLGGFSLLKACESERTHSATSRELAPQASAKVEQPSVAPSAPMPTRASIPSTASKFTVDATPGASWVTPVAKPNRSAARVPVSLTREVIRRVINRRINTIRLCYERGASHEARCARIDTQFTIEADGKVGQTSITKSETNDTQVDACVLEAVKAFTFPPPEGGGQVVVSYPFDPHCSGG